MKLNCNHHYTEVELFCSIIFAEQLSIVSTGIASVNSLPEKNACPYFSYMQIALLRPEQLGYLAFFHHTTIEEFVSNKCYYLFNADTGIPFLFLDARDFSICPFFMKQECPALSIGKTTHLLLPPGLLDIEAMCPFTQKPVQDKLINGKVKQNETHILFIWNTLIRMVQDFLKEVAATSTIEYAERMAKKITEILYLSYNIQIPILQNYLVIYKEFTLYRKHMGMSYLETVQEQILENLCELL